MSYKKIVFLVETPILERYYKRYGIQELRDLGFETTIFDLSPILLPTAYANITSGLCDYDKCGFYRFHDLKNLKTCFSQMDSQETLLICSMGYMWSYRKVFRLIKKYKLHFCYFMQEITPTDNVHVGSVFDKKITIQRIKHAITRRIPKELQGVPFADFVIGCGADDRAISAFKKARLCKDECPVVYFHSSNYEECLLNKDFPRIYEEKYCVFIDQYLPHHTDLIDQGIQIDEKKYYKEMNMLFDSIEKEMNIKVIVAAHPRSDYAKHKNVYGSRDIVYNKTCQLVKDSEFVIYHFSNSLSYVSLFRKPMLIVVNDDIMHHFSNAIMEICKQMKMESLSIDRNYTIEEVISKIRMDKEIYKNYVKMYMKKDYEEHLEGESLWVQVGDFLQKLDGKI